MSKAKLDRQQRALERLTAKIGEQMSRNHSIHFSDRMEYNRLKDILAKAGRTHEGRI